MVIIGCILGILLVLVLALAAWGNRGWKPVFSVRTDGYIVGAAISVLILVMVASLFSGKSPEGTAEVTGTDSVSATAVVVHPADTTEVCIASKQVQDAADKAQYNVVFWIVIGLIALAIVTWVRYRHRTGGVWARTATGPRGRINTSDYPPTWLISLVVIWILWNFLLGVVAPVGWYLFRSSDLYWGMLVTAGGIAYLLSQSNGWRTAGHVLLGLAIAALIAKPGKSYTDYLQNKWECERLRNPPAPSETEVRETSTYEPAGRDTMFVFTVRTGQPVTIVLPHMWRWELADPAPQENWRREVRRDRRLSWQNLLVTFYVVEPDTAVTIYAKVERCRSVASCK